MGVVVLSLSLTLLLLVSCTGVSAKSLDATEEELRSAVVVNQLALQQLLADHDIQDFNIQIHPDAEQIRISADSEDAPASHQDQENSSGRCPYPYTQVLDECFYLSTAPLSWSQARHHCRGMAGDLAVPKHIYALKSFARIKGRLSGVVWIGMSDQAEEGTWRWINSNESVDLSEFFPGEPNGGVVENCGCIWLDHHPTLCNYFCDLAVYFLCQYNL